MKVLLEKIRGTQNSSKNNENDLELSWSGIVSEEGQLAIDVYETKNSFVVCSTIAGAKAENIEISINNDMLTIKGERAKKKIDHRETINYLYQECFWGKFSRSIILPKEVRSDKIKADFEDGILTITLPIDVKNKDIIIKVNNKS
ncbi:MAG: Hsp20/alpha crystallin family protein [Candidatus Falkowbacteria bacterium]|nr:Hsp20/alpha crystallin family protein [Candidatus Falkowbacteria bacterium]